MNREDLIAIATKLSALRIEVARLEAVLDIAVGVTPVATRTHRRNTSSIENRILNFLEASPEREWAAAEIAANVNASLPTARVSLSRLRKSGRITDTKRGYVQAKDEYCGERSAPPDEGVE